MNLFRILMPKQTVTYFSDKKSLDQAVHILMESTYTAVPVIDDEGRYVGIVSEGDFLRAVMKYGKDHLCEYKIEDIVNKDRDAVVLNTVEKDEILEKILDKNFLVMVDDRNCFIGIVTRKNIISYLK